MATINVTAQIYENYSDDPTTSQYWKAKGGHTFQITEIPSDFILYSEEELIRYIKFVILASESNYHEKFEYLSHEVEFGRPTQISLNKEAFLDYRSQLQEA